MEHCLHLSYVARARIDKAIKWAKNYHPLITEKEKKDIEDLKEKLLSMKDFKRSGKNRELACKKKKKN